MAAQPLKGNQRKALFPREISREFYGLRGRESGVDA
jgi:hypothetical protein